MELQGKKALITGAARGIGQAIAVELARAGSDILGIDLREEELQQTAEKVREAGREFDGFACDISEEKSVRELIEKLFVNGGFDILVNNAGVAPSGPFIEGNFSVWRKTLDINLTALVMLTHVTLPHMIARGAGHIVNIASIAGKVGTSGLVAYSASKHGVVGFSSALREELIESKIRVGVSCVCPVYAKTRMIEGVKIIPISPVITPRKVARAVHLAIKKNKDEICVPRWMRLVTVVVANMFPSTWKAFLRLTKVSRGWLTARKELPQ